MKRHSPITRLLALALAGGCLLTAAGCGSVRPGNSSAVYLVSEGAYPEQLPYPSEDSYYKNGQLDDDAYYDDWKTWWKEKQQKNKRSLGDTEGLEAFFTASAAEFLGETGNGNRVCSPVNIYLALAMLAELTDGNSRQEILTLLGQEDLDGLRSQAETLWELCYSNDGSLTSIPAGSVWLNEDVNFVQETLDSLAQRYHASSYQGEMGSEAFTKAMRDWLNEQTGGLLTDQTEELKLNADAVLALVTTLYFRCRWVGEFPESRTEKGLFHLLSADGESVECEFMRKSGFQNYYWGEGFSAVAQEIENGGAMWLLLPDEDVTAAELLSSGTAMEFFLSGKSWENSRYMQVELSMPKFDVSSQMDLVEGLKTLGLHDVFDGKASDFSPMTADTEGVSLTQALHGVRLKIDEEGCEAAAFTAMALLGAMPPEDTVEFTLDRPFLFAITSETGLPLFLGVVERP